VIHIILELAAAFGSRSVFIDRGDPTWREFRAFSHCTCLTGLYLIRSSPVRKLVVGEIGIVRWFEDAETKATPMKNPMHNVRHHTGKDQSKAAVKEAERRSAHRQNFVGEAQVIEVSSGRTLSGRTSDLAITGCYFDCLDSFPIGTLVRTRLKKGGTIVEVDGNVVYQMPGLGMGITFRDVSPENLSSLEKWVAHLPIERPSPEAWTGLANPVQSGNSQQAGVQFVGLVRLLVKKGVLTESEASGLLKVSAEK
jgi:hypothetical protein